MNSSTPGAPSTDSAETTGLSAPSDSVAFWSVPQADARVAALPVVVIMPMRWLLLTFMLVSLSGLEFD